jgi:hypothetical protein
LNALATPGVDAQSADGALVTLRAPLHDFVTKQLLLDALVRSCWAVDVSCEAPLGYWTSAGPDGVYTAVVPRGFVGYLEIAAEGYLPLVLVVDTPLYRSLELYSTGVLTVASHAALQAATGIIFGASDGLLFVNANDCSGAYAAGVSISATGGGAPFSFSGGVPGPDSSVTAGDGLVAFARTREGLVQVSGAVGGRFMDEQAVIVRGGGQTVVTLRPVVYDRRQVCPEGRDAQTCLIEAP